MFEEAGQRRREIGRCREIHGGIGVYREMPPRKGIREGGPAEERCCRVGLARVGVRVKVRGGVRVKARGGGRVRVGSG